MLNTPNEKLGVGRVSDALCAPHHGSDSIPHPFISWYSARRDQLRHRRVGQAARGFPPADRPGPLRRRLPGPGADHLHHAEGLVVRRVAMQR